MQGALAIQVRRSAVCSRGEALGFAKEIRNFGMDLMGRAMRWVSMIALTATTLWVLLQGYRIATGQSRENAMALIVKASKVVLIVSVAAAAGANGIKLNQMAGNLDKEIHQLFTGDDDSSEDAIDKNLAYTQLALAALDAVHVVSGDTETMEKKGRAMLMAGFGTASPPMAAGAMLLLFKFTLAFLIGIGPIFILMLIFDQTKDLFKKWLFYVIGTLFSMSMLSVVTAMVLKFTAKVAAAYWVLKFIPLANEEGLSSQALQQGGIGLLMTVLIVTLPTAVAVLWQGNMGSFMHFSAFAGGSTSSPGPQGQPPGSYGMARQQNDAGRPISEARPADMSAGRVSASPATSASQSIPGSRGVANRDGGDRIA